MTDFLPLPGILHFVQDDVGGIQDNVRVNNEDEEKKNPSMQQRPGAGGMTMGKRERH